MAGKTTRKAKKYKKETRKFQKEEQDMKTTKIGRAVLAAERITNLVDSIKIGPKGLKQLGLEPVSRDDMVFFAERLLSEQDKFKGMGVNSTIDIGYHYTDKSSLENIQTRGLMTSADRIKKNIRATSHGASFGDGIYTGNNPTTFMNYGNVGLIVARLQGTTQRMAGTIGGQNTTTSATAINTVIGDKTATSVGRWPKSDTSHEIVLKSSSQCLPLVRFNQEPLFKKNQVQTVSAEAYVHQVADIMQSVVDDIFNSQSTAEAKVNDGDSDDDDTSEFTSLDDDSSYSLEDENDDETSDGESDDETSDGDSDDDDTSEFTSLDDDSSYSLEDENDDETSDGESDSDDISDDNSSY